MAAMGKEATAQPDSADHRIGRPGQRMGRLLLVAAAAAVVVGGVLAADHGTSEVPGQRSGGRQAGSAGTSSHTLMGCFSTVVEGEVVRTTRLPGHRVGVELAVSRWLEPERGRRDLEVSVLDPRQADSDRSLDAGNVVLFMLPDQQDRPPLVYDMDEYPAMVTSVERQADRVEDAACELANG